MTSSNSPGERVRIDIAVCTFRRAELAATLASLGRLELRPGIAVRILVVDNDNEPSARERVRALAAASPHQILYIHAPAGNISLARNACLDHAEGDYLAFIDDDEVAGPVWLQQLLDVAEAQTADVVLGPVRALYGSDAPRWMHGGDFHSTLPVWVKGEIRTGYTCNVLLRLGAPSVAGRRFDLMLGRSGGEDTVFFKELTEAGGRIAFAPEAWVFETVPASRARLSWLGKRSFRCGQTHGRLLARHARGIRRLGQIGLAAMKSTYCLGAGTVFAAQPSVRNRYMLRSVMHAGAVSGLLGVKEIRQYGLPDGKGKPHAT